MTILKKSKVGLLQITLIAVCSLYKKKSFSVGDPYDYSELVSSTLTTDAVNKFKEQFLNVAKTLQATQKAMLVKNPKSPLLNFSYGLTLESRMRRSPWSMRMSYEMIKKSDIYGFGLSYNHYLGTKIGGSYIYAAGKNDYYKEKMQVFFTDISYVYSLRYFSPYAGISLGYASHKITYSKKVDNQPKTKYDSLAYGFNVGILIPANDSISISINYRLNNMGFTKEYRDGKSSFQSNINLGMTVTF
jgi:Outer membrane protein beta-barrel domain